MVTAGVVRVSFAITVTPFGSTCRVGARPCGRCPALTGLCSLTVISLREPPSPESRLPSRKPRVPGPGSRVPGGCRAGTRPFANWRIAPRARGQGLEPADGAVRRLQSRGGSRIDLLDGDAIDLLADGREVPPRRDRLEVSQLMRDVRDAVL